MHTTSPPRVSLHLVEDGRLVWSDREGHSIELKLTPAQLLQLAIDAMRVATQLQPACMDAVVEALTTTRVLPMEADPCRTLN